jgi:hypothetical protein
MHALLVTEKTLDFIQQVNGGVRPGPECLEEPTFFVHADRLDDPDPNQLLTPKEYRAKYRQHKCSDDNCNIVEKI